MDLDNDEVGAFAQQLAGQITGAVTTAMVVVGDRLGLYRALAAAGPVTPAQLASDTGTHERYIREWLAQQAAGGIVDHDAESGTFVLPPERAAVLADDDSPAAMAGAALLPAGLFRRTDRIAQAFRTGEGVAWGEQDEIVFEGTERFFRVSYRNSLVAEWLPALDGVTAKLDAGARVADVGTGHGAALIVLAEAFPRSRFVGYDAHPPSVDRARKRAAEAGVADRVRFEVADCRDYPADGYDLVCFFDTLHDLGDPVGAAAHARRALAEDGTLMLVEPVAHDDLGTNLATNPLAAMQYGASTFLCVANSLSQPVGLGLGAQAGEARLRDVLTEAGFTEIRRAAENPFNMVLEARPATA
ncbi:class I SAM-dependent methyltransferase [Pseudonocardia parietis]|uniref:SAM-dependent methyltransferase n=1 Tax=Pseudonocardia parietis TaxID=570936 RepID=A0ABS4VWW2_9PSEU|nr:methyltransferase domain-containing protein [Pseudonocardia parietis]MBP2368429.1 SAM-dependent methyltransferase [Pseudonocardia parietis]